jgi:hypothetical protein
MQNPLIASANTTAVIPAWMMIDNIVVQNTTANFIPGGINIGTTLGGSDIVAAFATLADSLNHIPGALILKRCFSMTNPTTIYVNATNWNAVVLNIFIMLRVID